MFLFFSAQITTIEAERPQTKQQRQQQHRQQTNYPEDTMEMCNARETVK